MSLLAFTCYPLLRTHTSNPVVGQRMAPDKKDPPLPQDYDMALVVMRSVLLEVHRRSQRVVSFPNQRSAYAMRRSSTKSCSSIEMKPPGDSPPRLSLHCSIVYPSPYSYPRSRTSDIAMPSKDGEVGSTAAVRQSLATLADSLNCRLAHKHAPPSPPDPLGARLWVRLVLAVGPSRTRECISAPSHVGQSRDRRLFPLSLGPAQ